MKTPSAPQFNANAAASTQAGYNTQAASQTFDYDKLAAALSQGYYGQAFQNTLAQNTMGQNTPYGSLTYTTSIDPITGQPKYTANTNLSAPQQAILNTLQGNQLGFGQTAAADISNNFGQYGGDPNLVGQAGSLTNQALDSMIPAWERFNAPARDQLRTQLINQGLVEGSPAYQQQMDMLTQQQQLNQGQFLASFQPQAFQEAQTQYQLPLQNAISMLSQSQPANLPGTFVNTPQSTEQGATVSAPTVNPVDYTSLAKTQFDAQTQAWKAKIAQQNALMGMGVGAITGIMGMPVNPTNMTFGGQVLTNLFTPNGNMGTGTTDPFGNMH